MFLCIYMQLTWKHYSIFRTNILKIGTRENENYMLMLHVLKEMTSFRITEWLIVFYLLFQMFAIVEFTNSNEVAVVSNTWLSGSEECWYPPDKTDVRKFVQNHISPAKNWIKYHCEILKSGGKLYSTCTAWLHWQIFLSF